MAIYNNTYSGIILKGLGGKACCGLLTMGFGVFKCTISIVTPPVHTGGGGGGSYAQNVSGFYVPLPKQLNQSTRQVLITVKMKDHSWRTSFVVSRGKADIVVKVFDFINVIKDRMQVGVNAITRVSKKITAVFQRGDK